ncbi:MAG: hypothetical protein KJO07_17230, partial [Deltaproteobacteria bacterium]|nr:hypothetical protein [Deltaproteobacteria bacterium]
MSQKKPAARDISDLKARLGLKKKSPSSGGVVAPPGASVPAPPGARPPPGMQPPQPQIPDAAKDPFGAMNAMAAHQAVQRQPEIIVVNDGKPVEDVGKKASGLKYAKIAGMILGPLIIGAVIGQISSSAKRSNEVIEDAGKIRDDLKKVNSGLVGLNDVLLEAQTRGAGGKGFKVNDQKLTKELDAFEFPKVDAAVVYQSSMYELPVEVVDNLLYYYQETARLKDLLNEHVTKSKADAKAIDKSGKRLSEKLGKGLFSYGAVIKMPSEDEAKNGFPPKVRIVELGAPVCQDGKTGQCSGPPAGFTVREDAKSIAWSNKKFPEIGDDKLGAKGVLFVEPTPVFAEAIAGAEGSLAQVFY